MKNKILIAFYLLISFLFAFAIVEFTFSAPKKALFVNNITGQERYTEKNEYEPFKKSITAKIHDLEYRIDEVKNSSSFLFANEKPKKSF